jgi:hypothetical protein
MPSFWDDWADEWFMTIDVRKTIPITAKEKPIAFFIDKTFKL